jgi:hypothetical protein
MQKQFRFWVIALMVILIGFLPVKVSKASLPAEIVIHTPGSESRVTSPIGLSASITPGADDLVRVSLIDQRGNLLARKLIRLDPEQIATSQLATQLAFEIPTEGTEALLTLATKDAYNRPLSLRAVPLTLNSVDEVLVEAQAFNGPWLVIETPQPISTHRSGMLTVNGKITPITTKPVIFELITDSGGLIGSKQLVASTAGEEVSFKITMTYGFINTTRDVRLVIRQTIDPFGVDVALDSIPILLAP